MQDLDIFIIKSAIENLSKLNDSIYFQAQKEGYHHLVTKTSDGKQTSIYLFKGLQNKPVIESLLNDYTYTTEAKVYGGKVISIEEYVATEYSKSPTRLKVKVDNGETYSITQVAKVHLKLDL